MVKGKGFRGVLEYCLRQEKGFLLETNMAGGTPRELAQEFGEIRKLRPNLNNAVSHVSISLPPGEHLTDDQWRQVTQDYRENLGFSGSQFIAVRHTDSEHEHMHLVLNRVRHDGTVVSDSNDYRKQEKLMRELEQKYALRQTTSSQDTAKKALTKGEIEYSVRTGNPSLRLQLQRLIDATLECSKKFDFFIAHLSKQGVDIYLNKTPAGNIRGVSFSLNGVAYKGSSLGKGYSWSSLIQRGLTNDQNRTSEQSQQDNSGKFRTNLVRSGNAQEQTRCGPPTARSLGGKEYGVIENPSGITTGNRECREHSPGIGRFSKGISR